MQSAKRPEKIPPLIHVLARSLNHGECFFGTILQEDQIYQTVYFVLFLPICSNSDTNIFTQKCKYIFYSCDKQIKIFYIKCCTKSPFNRYIKTGCYKKMRHI